IGGAMEVQLDKQGRILVPPYLRQYADLDRDVVLAGVGRKFEIWSQAHFEAQRQEVEEDFDNVMDELAASGMGMRL
ncbi:MAG: division/cell wall cluster transcriptional repressor MraZ, partial [Thermodesulfobacteriota bacterium]